MADQEPIIKWMTEDTGRHPTLHVHPIVYLWIASIYIIDGIKQSPFWLIGALGSMYKA